MEDQKHTKLSKSILDMKFMKKTKERVAKEEDDAQGNAVYSEEITEEMRRTGNIVFVEASIAACRELIDGRLSFKGMNPDVERLMTSYHNNLNAVQKRLETDVTDVEMAEHQTGAAQTISKKFTPKRNRNKNKFMKPSNDFGVH